VDIAREHNPNDKAWCQEENDGAKVGVLEEITQAAKDRADKLQLAAVFSAPSSEASSQSIISSTILAT
jgi:hypothetical protein